MEVATLQPYDCLKRHQPHHHNRRHLISPARKTYPNPNTTRSNNRRRRNSPSPPPPDSAQQTRPRSRSPPVLGQIRILKRGEEISLPVPNPPTMNNPEPEIRSFPGPFLNGFYAGSAFVTSPSPSELPLPAFFTRRNCGEAQNQEIACELRRVLKLG